MREKEKSSEAQMTLLSPSSRSQLTFPYHILKRDNDQDMSQKPTITKLFRKQFDFSFINFSRLSLCSKVYAAEKEEGGNGSNGEEQQTKYSRSLDDLARAYIQQESGMDRIRMIFEKDHRGKTDLELNYIQVALVQVFVITFFGKYIPAAKFARKEFIRENQGTVFKTRFMAVRRLQDHTFMKAGAEAAAFSTKITLFSGSFLLLSSMISSYRNKTSVLEYALAAGITGGLARLNMGLRGFIAGSVVGGFLGSFVGLAGYLSLSAYGFTQEERHLETIKAKLEVLKSIEGESSFRKRINEILVDDQASGVIQSS